MILRGPLSPWRSSLDVCGHRGRNRRPSLLHYPVSSLEIALLFGAALVAGALNSIAGGGSFLSFPLLLFLGIPSVVANATNTVALWPGTLASTGAYRKALNTSLLKRIAPMAASTVLGSLAGAW